MNYVVGFMFSKDRQRVLLVRKSHPGWQAGKLNGVGGKIELNEPPYAAMLREFHEETGLKTAMTEWQEFATLSGLYGCGTDGVTNQTGHWCVHFFRCFSDCIDLAHTTTDEEVFKIFLERLPTLPHLPNLAWLIPMALSLEQGEQHTHFNICEE